MINPRFGNYLRRLDRTEETARSQVAAGIHWQRRADAAKLTQRYRHNPRVITRRLEDLEADQRQSHRTLANIRAGGNHGEYAEGGAYASRAADTITTIARDIARLGGEIVGWRAQLAALEARGVWRAWTRETRAARPRHVPAWLPVD